MKIKNRIISLLMMLFALPIQLLFSANAQAASALEKTRANLMVVVRESIGADKKDELLKPTGKARAKLQDGREIEFEMASWEWIGDMHIRFVFDGANTMAVALPEDLTRLNINSVDEALSIALTNVKRVYGEPAAALWTAGIMAVSGKSPDLDSTYVLDREFWRNLLKDHPDGIAVAVPKRGGLLYVPVSDTKAVEGLKKGIAQLYASSGSMRVSSAIFLFKNDQWSVLQSAIKP